jgi:hypothetical protein
MVALSSSLNLLRSMGSGLKRSGDYVAPIADYISGWPMPPHNVLFVGHSLAGGLAQILGATLGHPVVSVSGPGVGYSRIAFGLPRDAAYSLVTHLRPEMDPIPAVDKLVGLVQMLPCPAHDSYKCHGLASTLGTILHACGNEAGRAYQPSTLGAPVS